MYLGRLLLLIVLLVAALQPAQWALAVGHHCGHGDSAHWPGAADEGSVSAGQALGSAIDHPGHQSEHHSAHDPAIHQDCQHSACGVCFSPLSVSPGIVAEASPRRARQLALAVSSPLPHPILAGPYRPPRTAV